MTVGRKQPGLTIDEQIRMAACQNIIHKLGNSGHIELACTVHTCNLGILLYGPKSPERYVGEFYIVNSIGFLSGFRIVQQSL